MLCLRPAAALLGLGSARVNCACHCRYAECCRRGDSDRDRRPSNHDILWRQGSHGGRDVAMSRLPGTAAIGSRSAETRCRPQYRGLGDADRQRSPGEHQFKLC